MFTTRRALRLGLALVGGAAVALPMAGTPLASHAATSFAVGIPTIVDPVRGGGEPDILVDNSNNALITAPAGSGAQTSFFWRSRDGGLTYPMLGPSAGHWICPAAGGGDSLAVMDRKSGNIYLTDQEALADIGSAVIDGRTGAVTTQCASAPGATADRPFEAVLNSTTAPQSVADPGKQIVYLSWLCSGCLGAGGANPPSDGGLAFGWSDDGVTFHAADPGVSPDTLVTNTLEEGNTFQNFSEHGNTVVDPRTGYVYTGVTCSGKKSANGAACPNTLGNNEVGIAIGAPQSSPAAANIGQFSKLTYQTAVNTDPDGTTMSQPNSLFPVLGMDSNGTLYEAYIEGDGFATPTDSLDDAAAWHIYYAYSTDAPLHQHWSKPIQVDKGNQTATTDFGWMSVGDPGKLGFAWLGTPKREHPSFQDKTDKRFWHPFMAVTTDGLDAHPQFQQQEVGIGPNHINDMCLQGTVGCIQNIGNRNMADFISTDIGPDGALQMTWANDSNELATLPTTLIPGLPLTETAREVSGPRLIGSGDVSDSRFSSVPTTAGISDATGDALYPVDSSQGAQSNQKQLDLTASRVAWDGQNVVVHLSAADLSSISSPNATQPNVWYLTTWQFNHTIYFARAQSSATGMSFAAGPAASFDRVGLNGQTVATLVDYSGGTAVQGSQSGNDISITVPASLVGNPSNGSVLESVTAYTMLDNGAKPFVGPATGNMPTITDATPAYNGQLGTASHSISAQNGGEGSSSGNAGSGAAPANLPNTSSGGAPVGAVVLAGLALAAAAAGGRRRRRRS